MPYSDLQLADAFIQTGELADALDALDRHLAAHVDDQTARRLRAQVRARVEGQQDNALADFAALLDHTPEDIILQSNLLVGMGRAEDALTVIADGHTQFPDQDRLTERYLHLLHETGQIDKARAIVATRPADAWRWRSWSGDLAVAAEDDAAALTHYTAAISIMEDRYNLDALTGAAVLDDTRFGPTDRISDAAALTIEAEYARLLIARAGVNLRLGDLDAAEAGYVQAAVILPDDVTILFFRGLIAHQRGNTKTAQRLCLDGLAGVTASVREQLLTAAPADLRAMLTA